MPKPLTSGPGPGPGCHAGPIIFRVHGRQRGYYISGIVQDPFHAIHHRSLDKARQAFDRLLSWTGRYPWRLMSPSGVLVAYHFRQDAEAALSALSGPGVHLWLEKEPKPDA